MKRLFIILSAMCLTLSVSAQQKWGVVNFSTAFLRNAPDYEAPLETQALMGNIVEVMAKQGIWKLIGMQEPSYMAWTNEMSIVEMTDDELAAYKAAPKYICTKDVTAVYDRPAIGSARVSELVLGDIIRKFLNDKGNPTITVGYYKVVLPDGREGYVRMQDVADLNNWLSSHNATQESLVKTAGRFIGTPYLWGGTSIKNVDCSGLIWCVYFLNGIILPRNASQMIACGEEVPVYAMEPGDLVFFGDQASGDTPEKITHVAMYMGDNNIIHSSQIVRVNTLAPTGENAYNRAPLHARRILGHISGNTGVKLLKDSGFYF